MSLGDGWALLALLLLVPLVWMHLRSRGEQVRDVPSLLLWQELETDIPAGRRRLRRPVEPLLLALQALGLILLVLALANPFESRPSPPSHVVVLDDSMWMQAPGRLADGERAVEQAVRGLPHDTPVAVVLAGAAPTVLYRGDPSGVSAALKQVRPSAAPGNLSAALDDAVGLENGPHAQLVLIRAPEDGLPPIRSSGASFEVRSAGAPISDQGIFDAEARCGIPAPGLCEVSASVGNTGPAPIVDRVTATVAGRPPLTLSVRVGTGSTAPVSIVALPGEQVALRLDGSDPLRIDNRAWVIVPNAGNVPAPAVVTVVGSPSQAGAVARALAAVPGVELRLRTAASYRRVDALDSSLVVLDHFVPGRGLPPSPSVVLIDPPRLPGGRIGGVSNATTLSGTDTGSELLDQVDLSSLSISPGAARVLELPPWLVPVVWSPGGALLAAGDDGRQRLAVMSFEPTQSDLPQLSSFPVLIANLVRWGLGWAPTSAVAGRPLLADGLPGARTATLSLGGAVVTRASLAETAVALTPRVPGLYELDEIGPGVSHRATIAVSAGTTPASSLEPVSIAPPRSAWRSNQGPTWTFWLLIAALIVLAVELVYGMSRRPSAVG